MSIQFRVTSQSPSSYSKSCTVYLRMDNWNDWGFEVTYRAYFVNVDSQLLELGRVKFGRVGLQASDTGNLVDDNFDRLEDGFFSLGETSEYYEKLNELNEFDRVYILQNLNDLAFNLDLFEKYENEKVVETALLRGFSKREVREELNRLSHGGARLAPYSFAYRLVNQESCIFKFNVSPNSNPPTNIHVLIGRNGVGKTTILKNLTKAFLGMSESEVGTLSYLECDPNVIGPSIPSQEFATLSFVSFSAFDDFDLHEHLEESEDGNFSYIGLKNRDGSNKGTTELVSEFIYYLELCWKKSLSFRWKKVLSHLNTDPIIKQSEIVALILESYLQQDELDGSKLEQIKTKFCKLSSGHKIVFLTLTALVSMVEQNSLVLFDEPEAHLHPPLLSAFIRAVSTLMIDRNAVAIMATHSPVILQETPKSCVSILSRVGAIQKIESPKIETFGENVGTLTREVFKLEVTQAGFYQLIEKISRGAGNLDALFELFDDQLGSEAKMLAMSIFFNKDE